MYLMVTRDKYELPLGVYDSLDELAERQGVRKEYVKQCISRYEHGTLKGQFRKVVIKERKRKGAKK